MQILRARLGFAALQMFPEDKQDEISSSVLGVGTGEGSQRDLHSGTTGNLDKESLLFRSAMGILPDSHGPGSAGMPCQSAHNSGLACIFYYQRFIEVLL